MYRVALVQDSATLAAALAVRWRVFVDEQGVDPQIEVDGLDPSCRHVVALCGDRVVGTARLVPEGNTARLGRMAVLPEYRRQGVGSKLLGELVALARKEGYERVYLHAQMHAVPFYAKFGFVASGQPFMEAGISHVEMELRAPATGGTEGAEGEAGLL